MHRVERGAIPAAVFASRNLRKQHREISLKRRREIQTMIANSIVRCANTTPEMHASDDVNDENLLAWPDGRILVLDADSFQTPTTGSRVFRCRAGKLEQHRRAEALRAPAD